MLFDWSYYLIDRADWKFVLVMYRLRSVDQEALPDKDSNGKIVAYPEKKWKGKEEYLLHFCGLG